MSSPLGGFYLAAHQRVKAAQQAERDKELIDLGLELDCEQQLLFQQQMRVVIGETLQLSAENLELIVSANFVDGGLCEIIVRIQGSDFDIKAISQQIKLVEGENMTTRFADDERVRLTLFYHWLKS